MVSFLGRSAGIRSGHFRDRPRAGAALLRITRLLRSCRHLRFGRRRGAQRGSGAHHGARGRAGIDRRHRRGCRAQRPRSKTAGAAGRAAGQARGGVSRDRVPAIRADVA